MNRENKSLKKHRNRRASDGFRYVQVHLDAETYEVLDTLRKNLHMKRKTSQLVKKALILLYDKTMKSI